MKKLLIYLLSSTLFLFQGCFQDFEEINTDPNAVNQVEAGLLTTSILFNTAQTLTSEAFVFTAEVMNQHVLASRNPNDVGLLNWRTRGPWSVLYEQIADIEQALVIARLNDDVNQEAVLLTLRAWIFSVLTDLYGDVPYADIIDSEEVDLTPSYNLQSEIYPAILATLEAANRLFDVGEDAPEGDILYGGDVLKWQKFTNSLRLRLLLRASEVAEFNASDQFAQIISNPIDNPIFESLEDHAVIVYDGVNEGVNPISSLSNFVGYFGSDLFVSTLTGFEDSRLDIFLEPSVSSVAADSPAFQGWVFEQQNITDDLSATDDAFAALSGPLGILMTYAELQFILAEAAQRGIINAEAVGLYESGIAASFAFWGVGLPVDYLMQEGVAYDGELVTILTQKWLNGFMTPYESWFDHRRTGLPSIPVDSEAGLSELPLRFGYPDTEMTLNAENYDAAVQRIGLDEPTTSMWLLN